MLLVILSFSIIQLSTPLNDVIIHSVLVLNFMITHYFIVLNTIITHSVTILIGIAYKLSFSSQCHHCSISHNCKWLILLTFLRCPLLFIQRSEKFHSFHEDPHEEIMFSPILQHSSCSIRGPSFWCGFFPFLNPVANFSTHRCMFLVSWKNLLYH